MSFCKTLGPHFVTLFLLAEARCFKTGDVAGLTGKRRVLKTVLDLHSRGSEPLAGVNWRWARVCEGGIRFRLDGFGEAQRAGGQQPRLLPLLIRLSGKLGRVREARAKRERAFGIVFKSQERCKKVGSALDSLPTH